MNNRRSKTKEIDYDDYHSGCARLCDRCYRAGSCADGHHHYANGGIQRHQLLLPNNSHEGLGQVDKAAGSGLPLGAGIICGSGMLPRRHSRGLPDLRNLHGRLSCSLSPPALTLPARLERGSGERRRGAFSLPRADAPVAGGTGDGEEEDQDRAVARPRRARPTPVHA